MNVVKKWSGELQARTLLEGPPCVTLQVDDGQTPKVLTLVILTPVMLTTPPAYDKEAVIVNVYRPPSGRADVFIEEIIYMSWIKSQVRAIKIYTYLVILTWII